MARRAAPATKKSQIEREIHNPSTGFLLGGSEKAR